MISIIIPLYNPGERLKKMLDCICNQELWDYEVILVDDGSTDGSGALCDTFAEKDHRFKVVHQDNKGVAAARNRGIAVSSGCYVVFLDADDEIPKNYLSVLHKTAIETKADIVVCDVSVINEGNESYRFSLEPHCLSKTEALNYLLARKRINTGPCGKLFKRGVIDSLRFPRLRAYEDIIFVRDTFDRSLIICTTNETEYRYISNTSGTMERFIKCPSVDIISASEDLVCYIEKHPELSPRCMYTTLSHLYQYIREDKSVDEDVRLFNNCIKAVFKRHWKSIAKCSAFTWKEKLLFLMFGMH